MKFISLLIVLFLFFSELLFSRPNRVSQIPYGEKFQCSSCHVSPNGGGQRTPFGETVNDNLGSPISTANVRWDLIFNIDSDGDGFTNGEELQDPDGQWAIGQSNPGNPELVFQPWNPNSKPTVSSVVEGIVNNNATIYPVPSNGVINLEYISDYFDNSRLELFNSNGNIIHTDNMNTKIGPNNWTINLNNQSLNSGIYYLVLRNKYFNIRKRIVFTK